MEKFKNTVNIADRITLGSDKMVLFAGPCAAESYEICMEVGSTVKQLCANLGIEYVFKSSFDKANRTSSGSYRGNSMETGLEILSRVKRELNVPIVTDVHESYQCAEAATVADVLQIPAFLCRQTDLLKAAAKTGRAVKIKKGQFMAPEDMQYAVQKVRGEGNDNVFLTERGASFGYHTLVVDMRSLPIMRQYSPVIFDVTHSVQQPGGKGGSSGGQREFAPFLARAAAAVGVDGFFIETHPNPEKALSDGPNMIPLKEMESFLKMIKAHWELQRAN
ncbi:MAG TPA: 3-deoxy-8-phosphooctulonate synthase [Cyclobacteriaceae bacterium]|nr:3-deoxy-8-phosphooctulonate synthase [Cyclobacteriaceae bacterium]HMV09450.1 3-deoxy-8-phosphooctulonate synthase [Cyclobacteriaceae bacterium]HMV89463.1 3-deoxy-8-phosphooctulonate synthase [Cyclobacteriaceae bacterium]HMX02471.1 3-deoxy-8-phosphooctulonate synthase [Cyclobacteriaceae bacterium]HMX51041.1 3-deoxy-8-phosphooctulonate synthase [Cyclobacteriaceae bacterium]